MANATRADAPTDGEGEAKDSPTSATSLWAAGRRIARRFGLIVGTGIGLLLVLAVAIEILMVVNARVVGEIDFSLRSDWDGAGLSARLDLPQSGGIPARPEPDPADTAAWRSWLVERHAPVIVQLVGHHPEWDLPVAIDFDGNEDPRDNPDNAARDYPEHATVYGELTAVTEDSYYLTYSLYHLRDYDHPVREVIVRTAHHDGDNEGLHLRVDRASLEVKAAETWFHNRFVLCDRVGESSGTDPVHGVLHLEGTHPVVYAQDLGHGVRCAQSRDTADLARSKVFRPALGRPLTPLRPDRSPEPDLTYALDDFDRWYVRAANDPAETDSATLFVGQITLSPVDAEVPTTAVQYIAGRDREDISHWSRPKPMWGWDDIWDGIPVAVWHFLPSYSFATRSGEELSHRYLYNRPAERLYGLTGDELAERIDWDPGSAAARIRTADTERSKWQNFDAGLTEMERKHYWWAAEQLVVNVSSSARRLFNRYVTRVFSNLG